MAPEDNGKWHSSAPCWIKTSELIANKFLTFDCVCDSSTNFGANLSTGAYGKMEKCNILGFLLMCPPHYRRLHYTLHFISVSICPSVPCTLVTTRHKLQKVSICCSVSQWEPHVCLLEPQSQRSRSLELTILRHKIHHTNCQKDGDTIVVNNVHHSITILI